MIMLQVSIVTYLLSSMLDLDSLFPTSVTTSVVDGTRNPVGESRFSFRFDFLRLLGVKNNHSQLHYTIHLDLS